MSEPSLERLSRFTPDAGRLDRDALLFAAGRDSARPNRGWIALASLLAGTQALSLALLAPRPTPSSGPGRSAPSVARARTRLPASPHAPGPPAAASSVSPRLWTTRHGLIRTEAEDRPDGDVSLIDGGPPLRAFPPPPSLLN